MRKLFIALSLLFFSSPVCASDDLGSAVYSICWELGGSHVDASECLSVSLKQYENKLKHAEDKALHDAKAFDQEHQPIHSYSIELERHQRLSNESFRQYMNAECAKVAHSYLSGNGAGDGVSICKINLINQRLERL